MSLSPRVRERQRLNDDEFHKVYYASWHIPKSLTVKLPASLESMLGRELAALHPLDDLSHVDDEFDWADVIFGITRDFNVIFPEEMITETNVTLDSLLQCLNQAAKWHSHWSRTNDE